MRDVSGLKDHVYDIVGTLHAVDPKFATIERYFYDPDIREILTSDGKPFLERSTNAGEFARVAKTSCFQ